MSGAFIIMKRNLSSFPRMRREEDRKIHNAYSTLNDQHIYHEGLLVVRSEAAM